jgi:hypothetical protein
MMCILEERRERNNIEIDRGSEKQKREKREETTTK